MARTTNRLSPRGVDSIGKPGLYADGGGLYLRVEAGGAKRWTFIYRWNGDRREMGMGRLLDVSLATARAKAGEARAQVAAKIDPIAAKRVTEAAMRAAPVPTFGKMAEDYVKTHQATFRNAKHRDQWEMTLSLQRDENDALRPTGYCLSLRDKAVDQIDTPDVLEVLKPIWLTKPETASRLRGRIERVLDAARALKHRSGDNPARWRGHLDKLLAKPSQLARGHHAAMPYADVPAFMPKLAAAQGMGARALEFAILTATRTGEIIGARLEEFDLKAAVWTIPGERMKAGREHRVPLVGRALEVAKLCIATATSLYVFPGSTGKAPISNMTMTKALRTAGDDAHTVHGFRSSFRDWVAEETGFPDAVAEAALAHVVGDKTERAYRRGDALEKRRALMLAWANYCAGIAGENVVAFSQEKRTA